MRITKELVAVSATPVVLTVLHRGDSYGYRILAQICEVSGGELNWTEGMLYPLLHRLESKKWIESYTGTSEVGRRRKYYRLLPAGRAQLEDQRRGLALITETLSALDKINCDLGGVRHVTA